VQTRSLVLVVAAAAASRIRPTITLRRDEVRSAAAADEVVDRLRTRMLGDGDVVAADGEGAVVRFPGRAGPFRYRTVEVVRFSDSRVTFQHLEGPFHRCRETIDVEPDGGGATIAHEGELAMRGGLIGWLFGLALVRPLFERHVADHLRALADDGSRRVGDARP
jgi:hypothetical protein